MCSIFPAVNAQPKYRLIPAAKISSGERTYKQARNAWEEENFAFEIENRVDVNIRNSLSCLI
jgi:hypothetical protein